MMLQIFNWWFQSYFRDSKTGDKRRPLQSVVWDRSLQDLPRSKTPWASNSEEENRQARVACLLTSDLVGGR